MAIALHRATIARWLPALLVEKRQPQLRATRAARCWICRSADLPSTREKIDRAMLFCQRRVARAEELW
jgi:hypothetical protein